MSLCFGRGADDSWPVADEHWTLLAILRRALAHGRLDFEVVRQA